MRVESSALSVRGADWWPSLAASSRVVNAIIVAVVIMSVAHTLGQDIKNECGYDVIAHSSK